MIVINDLDPAAADMVVEEWQSALLESLAVGYRLIVAVAVVAETPVVVSVVAAGCCCGFFCC